jgi:glycosyltransferase involved in cell wall biosynthesis
MTPSLAFSPRVSVIIPTHRPEHFVNALSCVRAQTYKDFEIIVSDNSGDDQIAAICAPQADIIYRRNTDGNPLNNIAGGAPLARGEFIKYLFDDDLLYPHCLHSMLGWYDMLDASVRKEVGLITASRDVIDDTSVVHSRYGHAGVTMPTNISGVAACKDIIIHQNNFVGEFSTVLFKRELVAIQPGDMLLWVFDRKLKGLFDVPFYLNLLQKSDLLYIPFSLSAFRHHLDGGSDYRSNPDFHLGLTDWYYVVEGAYSAGFLNVTEAISAMRNFITFVSKSRSYFPVEIDTICAKARAFLASL